MIQGKGRWFYDSRRRAHLFTTTSFPLTPALSPSEGERGEDQAGPTLLPRPLRGGEGRGEGAGVRGPGGAQKRLAEASILEVGCRLMFQWPHERAI
jgi:hypothetical protein